MAFCLSSSRRLFVWRLFSACPDLKIRLIWYHCPLGWSGARVYLELGFHPSWSNLLFVTWWWPFVHLEMIFFFATKNFGCLNLTFVCPKKASLFLRFLFSLFGCDLQFVLKLCCVRLGIKLRLVWNQKLFAWKWFILHEEKTIFFVLVWNCFSYFIHFFLCKKYGLL